MVISYRKKLIRITEVWGNEPPPLTNVDLIRYFQLSRPVAGSLNREIHTLVVDLSVDATSIFSRIKRGTRYEIRRAAESDKISHECFEGTTSWAFSQFCEFYNNFADQKNQPRLNRKWFTLLAESGSLILTLVRESSGEVLVWHAYLCSERATLLYSASHFRALDSTVAKSKISRANRYLHWQDMLFFKARNFGIYDFGGWYHGNDDEERLRINRFKEDFGGKVEKDYISESAVTRKGSLFLAVRQRMLGDAI